MKSPLFLTLFPSFLLKSSVDMQQMLAQMGGGAGGMGGMDDADEDSDDEGDAKFDTSASPAELSEADREVDSID